VEIALQEGRGERLTAAAVAQAPPAWPDTPARSSRPLVVAAGIAGSLSIALAVVAVAAAVGSKPSSESRSVTPAPGARQAIAVLSKPGVERVPFRGAAGALELVVGPRGRAALVLDGLAPAPSGRSYQAWHTVSGESASLGVFAGTEVAVPLAGLLPPGATVVVTLEPAGGSEVPSGRARYSATRRV
jgi:hypothetical protein